MTLSHSLRVGALAAAMAFGGLTSSAIAAVVEFDDRSAFDAATTITQTDDFEDLVGFGQPDPLVRGGVTFTSTNSSGLYKTSGFSLPGIYLASQNTGALLIELSSGATALGVDVADLWGDATLNFTLRGETDVLASGSMDVGNAFQFLGFTSTESIFSLELDFSGGTGNFEAIDNLAIGRGGNPSVVPLPAGMLLLLGGLGAFGFVRRRGA